MSDLSDEARRQAEDAHFRRELDRGAESARTKEGSSTPRVETRYRDEVVVDPRCRRRVSQTGFCDRPALWRPVLRFYAPAFVDPRRERPVRSRINMSLCREHRDEMARMGVEKLVTDAFWNSVKGVTAAVRTATQGVKEMPDLDRYRTELDFESIESEAK